MSQEERIQVLAELRLLRDEYVNILSDVESDERRLQLQLLLNHIDECIREEELGIRR